MASVIAPPQTGGIPTSGRGLEVIEDILTSQTFQRTPRLKKLLAYLWEHRGEDFSEYAVATEALGRRADFDPKTDATVRVEISRLRQQLKKFYESEGAASQPRVRIPMGSHRLEVDQAEAPVKVPGRSDVARHTIRALPMWLLFSIAFSCLILLAVDAYFRMEAVSIKGIHPPPAQADPLPPFWQAFLANGRPTHIIMPRPTFVTWGPDLIVRDTHVNDFSVWKNSSNLASIGRGHGSPSLMQNYAVAGDALGAVRLSSFLQAHRLPVTVATTADAPEDFFEEANIIALGTTKTLDGVEQRFENTKMSLHFRLLPEGKGVEDDHPEKGQPQLFPYSAESETRSRWPGILSVLPGRRADTHVMVLKSQCTIALANLLTLPAEADQMEKMWNSQGSPPYFEMVVTYEMNGTQCLRTWPVAMRTWREAH
jgi:hypothetical protein